MIFLFILFFFKSLRNVVKVIWWKDCNLSMDPQLNLKLPIPIIESIISFSSLEEKLGFRLTCKRFFIFATKNFFPVITTILCGGCADFQDGDLRAARFWFPSVGVLDSSSTNLFVSDQFNDVIRKIDLISNQVTTFCGTPKKKGHKNGLSHEAQFCFPLGLALHEEEKVLYVADTLNHAIRSVNLMNGEVDTLRGTQRIQGNIDAIETDLYFTHPYGLALDSIAHHLYVTDIDEHCIKRVVLREKRVETLCGSGTDGYVNGTFEESMFDGPCDITFNPLTQDLYMNELKFKE